jgi:DNA invertase Pin-like site-specific DNA recombinase
MNAGVGSVAIDLPQANPLTLHILAAVAEVEARSTSERTKAAVAAAKARGVVLGNPTTRHGLPADVWRKGLSAARVARRDLRDQAIEAVAPKIKALVRKASATIKSRSR